MEKNIKKAKLIIFTGPSGVGKGTILKEFFKINAKNTAGDVVYSISSTTRAPREGEINGVHYHFISKDEFENLVQNDVFLEWAKYSDNYYGTDKNFVQKSLDEGKSVILEIELQGALNVMAKCPEAVSIFIMPPDFKELERRLRGRKSEDEASIQKRLAAAKKELEASDKFQYKIKNETVEGAVSELIRVIEKEAR